MVTVVKISKNVGSGHGTVTNMQSTLDFLLVPNSFLQERSPSILNSAVRSIPGWRWAGKCSPAILAYALESELLQFFCFKDWLYFPMFPFLLDFVCLRKKNMSSLDWFACVSFRHGRTSSVICYLSVQKRNMVNAISACGTNFYWENLRTNHWHGKGNYYYSSNI